MDGILCGREMPGHFDWLPGCDLNLAGLRALRQRLAIQAGLDVVDLIQVVECQLAKYVGKWAAGEPKNDRFTDDLRSIGLNRDGHIKALRQIAFFCQGRADYQNGQAKKSSNNHIKHPVSPPVS